VPDVLELFVQVKGIMPRFKLNRQWTLILALGFALACCSLTHQPAIADPFQDGSSDGSGVVGNPPPGVGDPDVPDGPGKTVKVGRMSRGSGGLGVTAVGDGESHSVMIWRLNLVLMGLRGFYFRF
jgi:hypothetical protein